MKTGLEKVKSLLPKTNPLYWIVTILIIVIILMCLDTCNKGQKVDELNKLMFAMNDTMVSYRNKNGEHVAKIAAFETQSVSDFLKLQTQDSVIKKLQDEVKRYKGKMGGGGSVTVITTETSAQGSTASTITESDTVIKDNIVYIYPKYEFTIDQFGKWITGNGYAKKDSTFLDLKVVNNYTVAVGYEKRKVPGKLFKQKVAFAEVTNENPYTETKSIKSYTVSAPKQKNFGVMVGMGYGGYFDPTRLRIGHGVTASLMLGYQIIPIK